MRSDLSLVNAQSRKKKGVRLLTLLYKHSILQQKYGVVEASITMLRLVEIENFKSIKDKQVVQLCDNNDAYPFAVVVGKNGSGKSNIMEAIEWCLYDKTRKEMRASSIRQLVNQDNISKPMSVTLEVVNQQDG